MLWKLFFLSTLFSAALTALALPDPPPQVQIGNTTVVGASLPLFNEEFFGGIPFAEPPVGTLRFARPKPKFTLDAPSFTATDFGLPCLQPGFDLTNSSEDCLTINVYRPAGVQPNASLAVMAWIYGGGFLTGYTSIFNASVLVEQSIIRGTPIIYVSMNYRVGPLGWPQGDEAASHGLLNLGLRDQLLALQWVQANIAAFGGDPKKVTVFGESAGAVSAALHYLNDYFPTVARAAIFESGLAATIPLFRASRGLPSWLDFAGNVSSCATDPTFSPHNTLPCLLKASSSDILFGINAGRAVEEFGFPPVLDGLGGLISDLASPRLLSGAGGHVPLLAGTNLDEGTAFAPTGISTQSALSSYFASNYTPSPLGPFALDAAIAGIFALYPDIPSLGSPYGTGNNTFGLPAEFKHAASIGADLSFHSQRRLWARILSQRGTKFYGYLFTDPSEDNPEVGVTHGLELLYVYGVVALTTGPPATLSLQMMDYWISFATSLDPNDGKGTPRPTWDLYGENQRGRIDVPRPSQSIIQLNATNTTMIPDTYRAAGIEFMIENRLVFSN
ncbi:esterase 1 [Artomyces pyxidatus]|uniref:Esterase 1 n=1 Tax=Artomyces pyxidatus TaxID=48021 RepID=A0ACB8TK19_9AGAM|nr:esterase 1 [Artomyces pyxidatus]